MALPRSMYTWKDRMNPDSHEMADYRARKAGIALKIQKKGEDRYDEEDGLGTPHSVMTWMNETLGEEHQTCPASQWRKLQFWLRDGVALCKFINKLREADGMEPVKYKSNATTAFIAMENIELFNKAAVEYGIKQEDAFSSIDLYEGLKGPLLNVINALNKVGFVAIEKNFTPPYAPVKPS